MLKIKDTKKNSYSRSCNTDNIEILKQTDIIPNINIPDFIKKLDKKKQF